MGKKKEEKQIKKVLFTATVDSHILHFHIPYLKLFKDEGYEVHVATNGDETIPYCDKKHKISFERSPFKLNNLKAIKQLKKVIASEHFDIIHCHTPMGSVVTRLAAIKARKNGTRVIYTAHGFHFYKGAPKLNWILFYPIEKILSRVTDTLITINEEDYNLAKKKFHSKQIELVHGVGVDPAKFNFEMSEEEKDKLRKEIGINKDDFVMIYPAELSKRKNQGMLLRCVAELVKGNKNIKLLLPGLDSMNGMYQQMAKDLNIEENVKFLGYRTDIPKLLKISNLAVSAARQEGLPVNIMEAMACGMPAVVTNCRGNRDLVENGVNGYVISQEDNISFCQKTIELYSEKEKYELFAKNGYENSKQYALEMMINYMKCIYDMEFNSNQIAKNVKVSVIVPVYNAEIYLKRCINSIINQTYKNIELIMINDGSTDESEKIIKKYQEKDKRIFLISQENSGPSKARNEGIRKSSGNYIMFVDSDDWIETNMIEEMVNLQDLYKSELVYCNYIKEYSNKSMIHHINNIKSKYKVEYYPSQDKNILAQRVFGNLCKNMLQPSSLENLSPSCMKLYTKEIIDKHNIWFVDHNFFGTGEDTLFNAEYLLFVKKAVYLNKALYHYTRNNNNSLTRQTAFDMINKKTNLHNKLEELITKYSLPSEYYLYLKDRKAISVITSGMCIEKVAASFFEKRNEIKKLLNNKEIEEALYNLNLKGMKVHWKLFFQLCKSKKYTMVLALCKIMNIITNKK